MNAEKVQDLVLGVLGVEEKALTAEEVHVRIGQGPPLREVRIALRDLLEAGEVRKDESGHWRAAVILRKRS